MATDVRPLPLALVLLGLLLIPAVGSAYLVDLTTEILIYCLFALSLNVLLGFAGSVSFGHAAFFAIGGYTAAILQTTYQWPLPLSLLGALVLTGATATVIGYFCVKLDEIYFAMLTLAFSMFVWAIAFKWRDVTGGDDGFVGVTVPALLDDRAAFYYFALAMVGVSTALLWWLARSGFGAGLLAIRQNSLRAQFIGMDVKRMRLAAFVIAGIFAGIAGALLALYNRGMYVETAFWPESARVLIMVLLGGINAFFGPIIGAAVLYLLDALIGQVTVYQPMVFGLILLAVVMFAPEGLSGLYASARRRRGSRE